MKNKMSDLRNHLFEALERLNDEDLKGEELQQEALRSKAMVDIAKEITSSANLEVKAIKDFNREFGANFKMPRLLGESNEQMDRRTKAISDRKD